MQASAFRGTTNSCVRRPLPVASFSLARPAWAGLAGGASGTRAPERALLFSGARAAGVRARDQAWQRGPCLDPTPPRDRQGRAFSPAAHALRMYTRVTSGSATYMTASSAR